MSRTITTENRVFTAGDAERFKAQRRAKDTRPNEGDISSVEFFCDEMDALAEAGVELFFITRPGSNNPIIVTDSLAIIPGINADNPDKTRLPVGSGEIFTDGSTTFIMGNAVLDMRPFRPRKGAGTRLSNLNFFKGTGDTSVVFSGSFDSTVIKTDSPLNNGIFDDVIIDVTASSFDGVTAMFTTLISGTFKSAGKFALARIGLVGDITMDVDEEMGGAPFIENRGGFITSAGVDWLSIAEKATGEGDMAGWSLDMQEIMRANVEAGDLPRFNNFCVNPAADVIDCDCATWLFFRDTDKKKKCRVWVWRNSELGNPVDPDELRGINVGAVKRAWQKNVAKTCVE
jgi:hypothetical protein